MVDLDLRPSGLEERFDKPWSLQLRSADMAETSYATLAHVSDDVGRLIIEAGAPCWLFGEPDWEDRARLRGLERARVLEEQAAAIRSANQSP